MEGFMAVDSITQEIVGFMVMARREPVDPAQRNEATTPSYPDGVNEDICEMVYKAVAEVDHGTDQEQLELVFIVVKPLYRRRVIGSALMKKCFAEATYTSAPIVLCFEPAACDFFNGLGFQETKHADMDLSKHAPAFSGFGVFRLTGMVKVAVHEF